MLSTSFQAALLVGGSLFAAPSLAGFCKPRPNDPHWPSPADWNALNTSVSGRLIVPTPLGSVCHPGQENYNNASCQIISSQWMNSSLHSSDPVSMCYSDVTCLPDPNQPCSPDGNPAYVVKAESVADVQQAVKFASRTGVRLVVKGTGHDTLGRSTGAGTLSVWTHNLRGVQINRNDPHAAKYGGVAAVKISAGMRWGEVYEEMAKQNLTVVAGEDHDVGVGGLLLGGGHSPISAYYGFPADNVLEMEVVTADGQHRVINESSNSDLFWAMRGSGFGYAVLLSATLKAYPQLDGVVYNFGFNTTANSDTLWSLTTFWLTRLSHIVESGGMGYYDHATYKTKDVGSFWGYFFFPKQTVAQVNNIINPVLEEMNRSSWAVDPIHSNTTSRAFPSFMKELLNGYASQVGPNIRIGSWLIDGEGLSDSNFAKIREQIHKAAGVLFPFNGCVVSGPGVRSVDIPGGGNAVLPAWRNAISHTRLDRIWPAHNETVKYPVLKSLREKDVPALKALAPKSGSYMNEGDQTQIDWKNDFYGENYPKLLEIKNKWDPQGVFWCKPCVGHDQWEVSDGPALEDPVEWMVGQVGGRICKKDI